MGASYDESVEYHRMYIQPQLDAQDKARAKQERIKFYNFSPHYLK